LIFTNSIPKEFVYWASFGPFTACFAGVWTQKNPRQRRKKESIKRFAGLLLVVLTDIFTYSIKSVTSIFTDGNDEKQGANDISKRPHCQSKTIKNNSIAV
jgi:hypothetical protein